MPYNPPWSRDNPLDLARYINPDAKQWLRLEDNSFDLLRQVDGRYSLVRAIYTRLQSSQIFYDLEEFHPSDAVQQIRTPSEILNAPGQGTCLDLALLFCSLCLGYRLMPILIYLEGHALAAVSLRQNVDEWEARGRPRKVAECYPTNQEDLRVLIESQHCIVVECTGFASSKRLNNQTNTPESVGRDEAGFLSFERSLEAGKAQLETATRPLRLGLDVAAAHYLSRFEPYPIPLPQKFIDEVDSVPSNTSPDDHSLIIGKIPFRVPPLPTYFVERPEIEEKLKQSLCDGQRAQGVLLAGAVHGIGGLGKSILAAKVAHNPSVHKRFPDGILWTTLGQQPDLTAHLSDWIRELGDHRFQITSIESASGHLQTLLRGKSCLLIVDDVWTTSALQLFLVAGFPSQVLITTRNADIAKVVGAELLSLDGMLPGEALGLIENRLREDKLWHGWTSEERDNACAVAKELNYLPLALNLAAAQVMADTSWQNLMADLRTEVARLERLKIGGRLAEYGTSSEQLKDYSLLASFNLSIQRLDDVTRLRFAWLGILAEDANFDEGVCSVLWSIAPFHASETLRYLADKALVYEVALQDGRRQYRIHDLLHDTARIVLTSSATPDPVINLPCYGVSLKDAHSQLLVRYHATSDSDVWHRIPDDGYFHAHLTWHISQSTDPGLIHVLLAEQSVDGRNGWFRCREAQGQISNFVHDVDQALTLVSPPSSAEDILRWWRYALMLTTLNSLAERLPPSLIVPLVRERIWTPAQALTYIRRMSKVGNRAIALTAMLTSGLSAPLEREIVRIEALRAASEAGNKDLLLKIAAFFELPRRIDICRDIWPSQIKSRWPEQDEARTAVAIFEELDVIRELVPEMLKYATTGPSKRNSTYQDIDTNIEKLELLSAIAPYIPKEERSRASRVARKIHATIGPTPFGRGAEAHVAFAEILCQLEDGHFRIADLSLRSVTDLVRRAKLQIRVAQIARNATDASTLMEGAMDSLIHVKQKKERISAICKLAPVFNLSAEETLWKHALATVQSLDRVTERAQYAALLCEAVPEQSVMARQARSLALATVGAIKDPQERNIAISEVAIRLGNSALWHEIGNPLQATQQIGPVEMRAQQLCRLADYLPMHQRREILMEALVALNELGDFATQALVSISAARLLHSDRKEGLIRNCLVLLNKAIDLQPQIRALDTEKIWLMSIFGTGYTRNRARDIQKISVDIIENSVGLGLNRENLESFAQVSRRLTDHGLRARALTAIAQHLAPLDVTKLAGDAYSAVKRMEKRAHEGNIFVALQGIAPLLSTNQLQDALAAITKIEWRYEYIRSGKPLGTANWLRSLAPSLSLHPHLWDTATEMAIALEDGCHYYDDGVWNYYYREHALYPLVYYAPRERFARAKDLGLICRPTSDVDFDDVCYQLMLVSLASRENSESRMVILKRIINTFPKRDTYSRGPRGYADIFDDVTSNELYELIQSTETDATSITHKMLYLYYWAIPSARSEILVLIKAHFPHAANAIQERVHKNKPRQTRDITERNVEHLIYGDRTELMEQAPKLLEGVMSAFGADGVEAIVQAMEENCAWWP